MDNNYFHYNLLYSCEYQQKRGHEQFVEEHALGYLISGESKFFTNEGTFVAKEGTIGLLRKNQLVKSLKLPSESGQPFKSINIFLDQETLRKYASANNIGKVEPYAGATMIDLSNNIFLKGYFESLIPYVENPQKLTQKIAELKTNEAIELLLQTNPSLKSFLFDFQEPHKIDLEAYMNRNYHYNVPLKNFAKLTGRSLATFKRDFQKIFSLSPEKWLQQKRLQLAHYLIAEKHQKPSEVYLEVGFENLSHFSDSFKKMFGYNASSLNIGK
ncbi:hypothetical protein A9P82_09180 [Arachidicoccus ginsenosidimutans]|uniref:helix-turn-helix domain-containing protein n=1 Tax=Arachidicoccus sp. BS20 TaxID=1850526 RepID=UPI0007F087A1|nr:AraC family transcriptional regulator [Arachidicoccus sp. BS20]ANI90701.1 hypothetical protein A9P82_09180 [Arachidicoccus sp. BS20]